MVGEVGSKKSTIITEIANVWRMILYSDLKIRDKLVQWFHLDVGSLTIPSNFLEFGH